MTAINEPTRRRLRPVPARDGQPPHNPEAEEAVLGAVLASGRLLIHAELQRIDWSFFTKEDRNGSTSRGLYRRR